MQTENYNPKFHRTMCEIGAIHVRLEDWPELQSDGPYGVVQTDDDGKYYISHQTYMER